jgi:ABC-type lipoprotein export system ATPase subunit
VVAVTHDDEFSRAADRVIRLVDGRLAAENGRP